MMNLDDILPIRKQKDILVDMDNMLARHRDAFVSLDPFSKLGLLTRARTEIVRLRKLVKEMEAKCQDNA